MKAEDKRVTSNAETATEMDGLKVDSAFKTLLRIFFVTFKVGAFTFGGGYAMIPILQSEFVDKTGWIEEKDIVDVFAVAQSVPGVIAINCCILIGNKIAGPRGGFMAAFGCVTPSFLIISVITMVYNSFIANPHVLGALRAIQAAVVALLLSAVVRLSKQSLRDAVCVGLAAVVMAVSFFFSFNVVFILISAAVFGLVFGRGRVK